MKVGAAPTYPTIRFLASGSRRAMSEWTKPGVTVRRALTAVKRCFMVVTKRDASCASSFGHVIVRKYVCDHAVGKLNLTDATECTGAAALKFRGYPHTIW